MHKLQEHRNRPLKLGVRWIDNPTKIFYFRFSNMARLRKVLGSDKWDGRYEWAAIYNNNEMIEQYNFSQGWHETSKN